MGFRPKVGSAWPLPGAALIVAASAGILWLPEVRARLFPSAPIVWRMTPGPSIDIRPALPPESAEADRMGSAVLIGMQPGFASEGGRRGEAVVSSQTVSLQFPDKPPITFNWWIFSNNADQGPYINQLGAAAPLALADGAGGREAMFQPVGDYVWAQFVADVKDAYSNGADELGILVKAEVQTEGRRDMLTARCDQPLEPIMLLIAESNAGLPRWIVRNCAVADAPPASDHKTNQEN